MIVDLFFRVAETITSTLWGLFTTSFTLLPSSIALAISKAVEVWAYVPGPIRAIVPGSLLLVCAAALFVLSASGAIIKAIRFIISLGTGGGGGIGD